MQDRKRLANSGLESLGNKNDRISNSNRSLVLSLFSSHFMKTIERIINRHAFVCSAYIAIGWLVILAYQNKLRGIKMAFLPFGSIMVFRGWTCHLHAVHPRRGRFEPF